MKSLKDKTVIVTGGGSGIGEATAQLFASYESKVVIADIDEDALDRVCSKIRDAHGEVLGVLADVAKKEDLERLVNQTIDKFGTIDIVINNAGIIDNFKTVDKLDLDMWQRVMDVNLKGPTILSGLAVNFWLKHKQPGVIINIGSVGGMFGARGGVSYTSSKHAIIGLTRNIATVYHNNNIRCVAVAPGWIGGTKIIDSIWEQDKKGLLALLQNAVLPPKGSTEDIANVVAFLSSEEAGFINGAVVTVDGGWTVA